MAFRQSIKSQSSRHSPSASPHSIDLRLSAYPRSCLRSRTRPKIQRLRNLGCELSCVQCIYWKKTLAKIGTIAMNNLRALRTFVVTAETGGLGRASARLHLSQPAASRQIHALEQELGVALFQLI